MRNREKKRAIHRVPEPVLWCGSSQIDTLAAAMLLLVFILLQALDALTTVAFLRLGVAEGNPLIRRMLAVATGHTTVLIAPKLFAAPRGIFAWRTGRKRLLLKMDVLFALAASRYKL